MTEDGLQKAARVALTDCLAVREGERVLLITNPGGDAFEFCQGLFVQARALRARPVMVVQEERDAFSFADPTFLDEIRGEPEVIITVCRGGWAKPLTACRSAT